MQYKLIIAQGLNTSATPSGDLSYGSQRLYAVGDVIKIPGVRDTLQKCRLFLFLGVVAALLCSQILSYAMPANFNTSTYTRSMKQFLL